MNKNFTTDECSKWNKNKLINPKTNRNIKENSALYNNIKSICSKTTKKDINSIINDFCQTYKIKSSDILNSNDKYIYKKYIEFCNSIKDDLKKKVKDKSLSSSSKKKDLNDDLKKHKRKDEKKDKRKDERHDISSSYSFKTQELLINKFEYYNKIIKYLKTIHIKSKNCITLTSYNNKYLLTDNIKLYQQIGSISKYGIIYKAKNINKSYKSIPKFVVKIQIQSGDAKKELTIFKKLSSYAIKNNIIHIPLYYFNCSCDNIINEPAYPKLLTDAKNKSYSIFFYERADGDLNHFINSGNYDENIWKNIYEQIYMSIFIFHSLGYYHYDLHSGNFLYRKIKKGGCFHYKINGEDYYIENIGYIWMRWDYGFTKNSKDSHLFHMFLDYYHINTFLCHRNIDLELKDIYIKNPLVLYFKFLHKQQLPSGRLNDKIHIPLSIKYIQSKLWEKFIDINPDKYLTMKAEEKKINDKSFIKLLKDEKLLFSKTPIGEVIYSTTI